MKRSDWVLLAIVLGKNALTPAQLQKSLFLLGKKFPELEKEDFYSFIAYNYGPFDVTIYSDAEILEKEGKIIRRFFPGRDWPEYSPTEEGRDAAKEIKTEAGKNKVVFLEKAVAWTQSMSFHELIRAIYSHYPEYKKNSVFGG